MKTSLCVADIDRVLPQTQCGLCGYNGCLPYAQAILQGETIDRCPPGGLKTLEKLALLTGIDASPFRESMQAKAKPPLQAVIREAECIGCTKCIQACPVDAIVGAAKQMHTVISDQCTGCELCIPPCPVDCIELIVLPERNDQDREKCADEAKQRYQKRQQRLEFAKKPPKINTPKKPLLDKEKLISDRKQAIAAAIARVRAKKEIVRTSLK